MDRTDEKKRVEIVCYYAREDQSLLVDLKKHLKLWERQGLITIWTDTDVTPGTDWKKEIVYHLNAADIILLLVSPDFLASEYCDSTEMRSAMERYDRGEVRLIPIIARHCMWKETSFGKIQALPANAEPIVSPKWQSQDEAFTSVVTGIRQVVEALTQSSQQKDIQDVLTEFQPESQQEYLSRRTVVLGLAALGIATVGVGGWVLASSSHWHIPLVPTISSATPTLLPGTLLLTYTGHRYYIWSVAWSPDAKRIASGSVDQTVQVWEAISGKTVFTYYGHRGAQYGVYTVAWSPNGKRIASGGGDGDSTVQVWDAISGDHVLTYRGHSHGIHKLAWSPDGKHIVSGSFDHTAQVWNASTADHVLTYQGHSDAVYWVAWSPDAKYIVSGSRDKTAQVWDASTGEKILIYRGHSSSVDTVAWSPDGKRIASGGGDSTIQVWDAMSGNHVLTYRRHAIEVHSVAWSPNGKYIASASFDHTVQVWDASTGENVLTYRGHSASVFEAAWSPNGRRIASGSLDNTVQVWSVG